MAPNQAQSLSAFDPSSFDYGHIYVEIMEECRPFYCLTTNDDHFDRQKPLHPRLDDALKSLETNKKCNNTVSKRLEPMHYQSFEVASLYPTVQFTFLSSVRTLVPHSFQVNERQRT